MLYYFTIKTNNRGKSNDWEDGDILYIKTPNNCKDVWDQMLQNGRCTQEKYDASILPSGGHKWPTGTSEQVIHQGFVIEGPLTKSELNSYLESEETVSHFNESGTPVMKTLKRRKMKIVLENLPGISQDTINKMRSNNFTVATRYDKPILKSSIVSK